MSIPLVYTQVQIYNYILVLGSGVYTHGVHTGTNINFYSGVRIGCLYPLFYGLRKGTNILLYFEKSFFANMQNILIEYKEVEERKV